MPTAVLRIRDEDAATIIAAISPEARRDLLRTRISVRLEDGAAVISIDATDTSAMRAALNSYLECITITENINHITKVSA